MNPNLRKTLLASAIASLLMAPVLVTGQTTDNPRERMGTQSEQNGDSLSPMGAGPGEMAVGATPGDNPLFDRTPEEMEGLVIVGADGKKVGEITEVVMEPERQSVHAVVSSGGILGLGAKKFAIPFDELQFVGDELRLTTSWQAVRARGQYDDEGYIQFDVKDEPIRATAELWPGAVDPTYEPEAPDTAGRPEAMDPATRSEPTDTAVESGATDPAVQPGGADPAGSPGATDSEGRPDATDPAGRPGATDSEGRPDATDPAGRPEATDSEGRPEATSPASPESRGGY